MGFKDEVKALLQDVIDIQKEEESEIITDEEAIAAINVLNFAKYNKVPDVFLGCSAYNLLNVYVKQKSSGLSCQFHQHIHNILKGIEDINQPKAIKVSFDNSEKLNLLIISFWGFQFSFQSMRFNNQIKGLMGNTELKWDGVRKQKCASKIFNFALDSDWISNLTLGEQSLRKYIEKEVDVYLDNGYEVQNGRFVKKKSINSAQDNIDEHLKNYVRVKLYSCQDRPVILSAIYRRTWEKHVTFTSVKPYIPNTKVITICDHINLLRKDVENTVGISSLVPGRRYYIIGYCQPYRNAERMGVRLDMNYSKPPIFAINEFGKMPRDIFSTCHRFSIEEYLSEAQRELKL